MPANRNSTPEASTSSLRPPAARNLAAGHHLRASADISGFSSSPLSGQAIRPSSEVYYNQAQRSHNQNHSDDAMDKAAQQWIAEIEQNETTLEEMAAATLDQDFKDELSAIEQWFKVLSEAERTAALYALLQQTTQVQIRFFTQVLQEMAKSHPMSGILSPSNYGDKGTVNVQFRDGGHLTQADNVSNRMSDATGKLGVEGARNSMGRPPPSPGAKRNSVLDPTVINAMFPDAANAIAKKKAEYTQQTGNPPTSNRNSAAMAGDRSSLAGDRSSLAGDRSSLAAPTISAPGDSNKENASGQAPPTPWGQRPADRPKSSSSGPQHQQQHSGSQPPMGQFSQPPPSAGLRSARPPQLKPNSLHAAGNTESSSGLSDMPLLSPYAPNASWASMTNTPMVANFSQQQPGQNDMLANATAMKLAALSTVNNRIMLDDVKKYRRARSNDSGAAAGGASPMTPGLPPGANVLVVNESGQLVNSVNATQLAALQMQQQQQQQQQQQAAAMAGRRSPRPSSPGIALSAAPGGGANPGMGFFSPQNNGYLAAYDSSAGLPTGMSGLNLGGGGFGHHPNGSHGEGYISDHSDMARGRSPRGRRGTSKPPEDPTDPALLNDIPGWLRSLRLHKYTDNLKDMKWTDLVELDDKGLEDRGVNALGARRKMLKVRFLPRSGLVAVPGR